MNRPTPRADTQPADHAAVFQAVADAMATAETYAGTARAFAEIGDARGLAYAVRCTAAAVLSASSLVDELRPSRMGTGRTDTEATSRSGGVA